MDRLGLGERGCRAPTRPRLLRDDRLRRRAGAALPGYDLLIQAIGGLMSITGAADGARRRSASRSST